MKLTKFIAITTAITGLGITSTLATPTTPAQAKAKHTLKTFPKAFRHSWYTSAGKRGNAIKFKAKTAWMRYDTNTEFTKFHLHAEKLPLKNSTKPWIYAKRQHSGVHIGLWARSVTLPLEATYRVRTKTYRHHHIKVLQTVSGSHVNATYYPSKKIADHFNR